MLHQIRKHIVTVEKSNLKQQMSELNFRWNFFFFFAVVRKTNHGYSNSDVNRIYIISVHE